MVACNSANPSENKDELSKSDSLFEAVMEGHDVAMPKMMKLERLRNETQTALDSLNKLPAVKVNASYKANLDSSLKALDYADFSMNQWMEAFKYDSFKNNEAERVKYLESELVKVNKMKDAVLGSIQFADSVLKK